MKTGVRPRVNEAREFLEIAKDFKDSREIIREALSNSWDAGASHVSMKFNLSAIPGTKKRKINVEIRDNGEGMSDQPRSNGIPSEIECFFNLGDSYKQYGSIGSKGHGSKIFYKSGGITVDTWKDGRHLRAETEVKPWESLQSGFVPTYQYGEIEPSTGKGTQIRVDGFIAKQSDFTSLEDLVRYTRWFTVVGSFGNYFSHPRRMDLTLKPADSSEVDVSFGFKFPDENQSLENGTAGACKLFGPETISAGKTEDGRAITVEVVGALLGEEHRSIVPDTYTHMGLWLCKDYIRIERKNNIIEKALGGQYYFRSFLLFANCQQFDLTANRNDVRNDQEEYDIAVEAIRRWCERIAADDFTKKYFKANQAEQEQSQLARQQEIGTKRKAQAAERKKARLNTYNGRENLIAPSLTKPPRKIPQNEIEVTLLLQAMISSNHPAIDFTIGDYSVNDGVDMIVEGENKGMTMKWWVEIVSVLKNLFAWPHPPEGYHKIICYELGKMGETEKFGDGQSATLVKSDKAGRYHLLVGGESIDIYALKELLISTT